MMLISLEGHKIHCVMRFGFQVSNNEVEYEALIAELRLAKPINLRIYSDSQLIVNQVNDIYLARRERMAAYLEKTKN